MTKPTLSLLSRLWLAEPDAETLARAVRAGLSGGDPGELAAAWTDLFLLNVYPYGTAFTDISGELNGPAAAAASRRYETAGYGPPELALTGAPDHAGLCLGFLAHLEARGEKDRSFRGWTLDWLPVCALAVERQPSAHPFYRDMAAATREALLSGPSVSASAAPEDLAPVLEAGLRLPFGSRFDIARSLFEAAGECGRIEPVLAALSREAEAWDAAYTGLAREHVSWQARADLWRGRISATREKLTEMGRILDSPLELEYGSRAES